MKTTEIRIIVHEYQNIDELTENDQYLLHEARRITEFAYAPYSGFHVGAAILLGNGMIVKGNNQENSAYPSGLCAERVALFYANANYPDSEVKTIAISAAKNGILVNDPIKPCGGCRQTLSEAEVRFGSPIRIILDGQDSILVLHGVESLLPLSFSKKDLASPLAATGR
ncbi:MAG TPA: cytidine deaminase [Prolixibacteraceae bacterium]|nr:cytidine deaminase [Prolixibacteraceae bacterium]